MDQASLEVIYDALAEAIDQVDPAKTEIFLVKLALLNAQALASKEVFLEQIHAARQDL